MAIALYRISHNCHSRDNIKRVNVNATKSPPRSGVFKYMKNDANDGASGAKSKKTGSPLDPGKVTDLILFCQRKFLLKLTKDLNRGNVSFAQLYLLGYMATSRELTMTDIARKMGHSTAAATGLVDRLEKLGYVERTHATDDRRKVFVRIAARGIELIAKIREELRKHIEEAMLNGTMPPLD